MENTYIGLYTKEDDTFCGYLKKLSNPRHHLSPAGAGSRLAGRAAMAAGHSGRGPHPEEPGIAPGQGPAGDPGPGAHCPDGHADGEFARGSLDAVRLGGARASGRPEALPGPVPHPD